MCNINTYNAHSNISTSNIIVNITVQALFCIIIINDS